MSRYGRAVMIFCCRDGTISYAPKGEPPFNGVALPVYSVDSIEQARDIQTAACVKMYGPHPDYPDKLPEWFRLGSGPFPFGFSGEAADLKVVGNWLAELDERLHGARGGG